MKEDSSWNKRKVPSFFFFPHKKVANMRRGITTSLAQRFSSVALRGDNRIVPSYRVGDKIHGFEVVRVDRVKEKNILCFVLRHQATGARHLHLDTTDSNNTFAVTFLTVPQDNTGVAHILEHTALCGSEKYPVRDPFFNMIKRSLNTFMNAFTGADFTMYPFSSQNEKDFSNLMSVYLDATFRPKLERLDFLQEGHRFEIQKDKLQVTGVVFNEMHGALADASSLFREQLGTALYPTTTYGYNSGGDPKDIPKLTWEGLRAFHKKHYHPSNAWFYTYGDLPLENHLRQINEALRGFTEVDMRDLQVPKEKSLPGKKVLRVTGPPSPGQEVEKQHKAALVWLLNEDITNTFEGLAMHVLSELLLSGPSAPLYRALLETRIGSGYAPLTGFEGYNKQPTFGIGVTGASAEDAEHVPDIIMECLAKVQAEGFPQERIESIIHQMELSNKHVTTSFGLHAGMAAVHPWMHGADPVASIQFDRWIDMLRNQLAQGKFFERLISDRLIGNKHCVLAFQSPDTKYTSMLKEEERSWLDKVERQLTQEERTRIKEDAEALKERQNLPPNVDCLPTLTVDDIPVSKSSVEVENRRRIRFAKQPTNGLTYFNAIIDVSDLPVELMQVVPLWSSLLTSQGAGGLDHRAFAQEMEMYTGGVSFSTSISSHAGDLSQFQVYVSVHSHCLNRNVDRMMKLIEDLIYTPDWSDRENVAALVEQTCTGILESLTRSGHSYAAKTASAPFGKHLALSERWNGMTQVKYLSELARGLSGDDGENVLEKLLQDFSLLEQHFRRAKTARFQVNAEELPASLESHIDRIWNNTSPGFVFVKSEEAEADVQRKLFYPVQSQVNFVARALPTYVPYSHPDLAALTIGSKVLSSCFLHREIREKGGAYGGGCSVSSDGVFVLSSYRDPELKKTLATFEDGFRWMFQEDAFSDRDVVEAKLSVFSTIDKPVPPASKGLNEFTTGVTHAMREESRRRLLAVSKSDILGAFERHVLPNLVGSGAPFSVAALGSDQLDLSGESWVVEKI